MCAAFRLILCLVGLGLLSCKHSLSIDDSELSSDEIPQFRAMAYASLASALKITLNSPYPDTCTEFASSNDLAILDRVPLEEKECKEVVAFVGSVLGLFKKISGGGAFEERVTVLNYLVDVPVVSRMGYLKHLQGASSLREDAPTFSIIKRILVQEWKAFAEAPFEDLEAGL